MSAAVVFMGVSVVVAMLVIASSVFSSTDDDLVAVVGEASSFSTSALSPLLKGVVSSLTASVSVSGVATATGRSHDVSPVPTW